MSYVLVILLLFVAVEGVLRWAVRGARAKFGWLITEKDELPKFPPDVLDKFFLKSYSKELGWVKRPYSFGYDEAQGIRTKYTIGERGDRNVPEAKGKVSRVASFGDSYVFCRQVDDCETWQNELSTKSEVGVLNYGVGNYGADQALLRYKMTNLPAEVDVVILGFVPETICRINSYYKHYSEFGNILAFKPKFVMKERGLRLLDNPINCRADFNNIERVLEKVKPEDYFYFRKFRKYQFRGIYLLSMMRAPIRNTLLLALVGASCLPFLSEAKRSFFLGQAFKVVMRGNVRISHRMYENDEDQLLIEIVKEFKREAMRRGHRPVVLMVPQLLDLKLKGAKQPYRRFVQKIKSEVLVVDAADEMLLAMGKGRSMYINDVFGGHLNAEGNRLVSRLLYSKVMTHFYFKTG